MIKIFIFPLSEQPSNKIGDSLKRISSDSARDLSIVLQPQDKFGGKETQMNSAYAQALEEVNDMVEYIAYEITEIMVSGLLI